MFPTQLEQKTSLELDWACDMTHAVFHKVLFTGTVESNST